MTFLHVETTSRQEHKISLNMGVEKKTTSANLAGLLALPCRIGEFSCVPPHNEEEKQLGPHYLSTTSTKLGNGADKRPCNGTISTFVASVSNLNFLRFFHTFASY